MKRLTFLINGARTYANGNHLKLAPFDWEYRGRLAAHLKDKDRKDLGLDIDLGTTPKHTLTSALMFMCGCRPISAKLDFNNPTLSGMYNTELYRKLFSVVCSDGFECSEITRGIIKRRDRRLNIRTGQCQHENPSRVPSRQIPREVEDALSKIFPDEPFLQALGRIPELCQEEYNALPYWKPYTDQVEVIESEIKALLKNKNKEAAKLKQDEKVKVIEDMKEEQKRLLTQCGFKDNVSKYYLLHKYVTENEPNGRMAQIFDFVINVMGLTPGYVGDGSFSKNVMKKFDGGRPDGINESWSWNTPSNLRVYDMEVTLTVDDDLAEYLFYAIKGGPGFATFMNDGVITPKFPEMFSDLENV